jgi:hypothetical protein
MRTHLLHAVPAIETDANSDTGIAANDGCYAPVIVPSRPSSLVAIVNVDACKPSDNANEHDDYYLGGYAGI